MQVVGARESKYTGGSLRMASMRILGTVLGALFGYFALVIVRNPMPRAARSAALLLLLAGWVALLSKLRTIAVYSYGALVAQFSAYVVVFSARASASRDLDESAETEAVAWLRIEQNVLGTPLAAPCSTACACRAREREREMPLLPPPTPPPQPPGQASSSSQ